MAMTKEKVIKTSAIAVLNYITHSMIEYGFLLAHENELSDLKGLIPANSFAESYSDRFASWELETELLDILDDPAVTILNNCREKIQSHIVTYTLMNSLELSDTGHPQVLKHSNYTWYDVMDETPKYQNYSNIMGGLSDMFNCYGLLIWNLAHQQVLGLTDVFKQTHESFLGWDRDIKRLKFKNTNAVFLLEIYNDILLNAEELKQL